MRRPELIRHGIAGFPAGFGATLIWHQLTLTLLWALAVAPIAPFDMSRTHPYGVPAVLSLAFWGGVWGIALALILHRLPRGRAYWGWVAGLGAVLPTLVALLIVVPLKGGAVGAGWDPSIWLTALIVNAAWAVGTALFTPPLVTWVKSWY